MKKGLVHIYTGDGKGKTTAALGLGMRAAGCGFRVVMVQFLKTSPTGETKFLDGTSDCFEIVRFQKQSGFYPDMTPEQKEKTRAESMEGFRFLAQCLQSGRYDLVIADELMASVSLGLIPLLEVIGAIRYKNSGTELVMTGRDAPAELVGLADYVTEMKLIKHPYQNGVPARKGIEF